MIPSRQLHKFIGISLLLPLLGWVVTAFIFYVKPGYDEAYEILRLRLYPLENVLILPADSAWTEARSFRTILGNHLCVRTARDGWIQLDPATLRPRSKPGAEDLALLLEDAFSANPKRYGTVASMSEDAVTTTTGVRVTIDWDRMTLFQRGDDTNLIDLMYRIHYLQWTGIDSVDKVLGPIGLLLVLTLSILGIRLSFSSAKNTAVDLKQSP